MKRFQNSNLKTVFKIYNDMFHIIASYDFYLITLKMPFSKEMYNYK